MNLSSKLTGFLIVWIIIMAGGASALAIPNQREGDTLLPPNFEYGQGPEIAGEVYPPFGGQQSKVSSNPEPRAGHSDFVSSQNFSHSPKGSIDMSMVSDPDATVYATFDGNITDIHTNHKGETYEGSGGQLLWLYNSNSKNEALYAHILVDNQVLNNYNSGNKTIKKGQAIGRIATKENMKDIGINDYSRKPHLHFQLWLNGVEAEYSKMHKWSY